ARPGSMRGPRRRKRPDARGFSASRSRRSSVRHDANVLALLRSLRLERDAAVDEREQRVIAAYADIRSGVEARAPLAHDDVTGQDALAAEALHAEPFRFGIAAVLRAAACLFVCHRRMSSMSFPGLRLSRVAGRDGRDLHLGIVLPMSLGPPVVDPALELHDLDLL